LRQQWQGNVMEFKLWAHISCCHHQSTSSAKRADKKSQLHTILESEKQKCSHVHHMSMMLSLWAATCCRLPNQQW
jgi:hypothetical protein